MAKTQFGIFSLSQVPDLSRVVESFDEDLDFFELAEELGYDKVWIAEHLFSTYGLVTSTQVYAAAIAQRTKRIRIGMAVCAVPFNHPLRTASDFALVDVLSHGRLDFGVGRAYQPHEFIGLGVPMDRSREMLAESEPYTRIFLPFQSATVRMGAVEKICCDGHVLMATSRSPFFASISV